VASFDEAPTCCAESRDNIRRQGQHSRQCCRERRHATALKADACPRSDNGVGHSGKVGSNYRSRRCHGLQKRIWHTFPAGRQNYGTEVGKQLGHVVPVAEKGHTAGKFGSGSGRFEPATKRPVADENHHSIREVARYSLKGFQGESRSLLRA
jgi:hypothetical protein